jgi:hypothetical protein
VLSFLFCAYQISQVDTSAMQLENYVDVRQGTFSLDGEAKFD